MAILELEGFDYATGSNQVAIFLLNKYNGVTFPWAGSPGQVVKAASLNSFGGSSAQCNGAPLVLQCFPGGGPYGTLIQGYRYKYNTNGASNYAILQFYDSVAGGVQCGLAINSSKQIYFWRGTTATVVATGTTVLVAGGIYYIEWKVTFSNTGAFEVRINGVTEISSGSVDTTNTANNSANGVQILGNGGGGNSDFWDDFYLSDNSGGAPNNDFLFNVNGPPAIETKFVTSNDAVAFTPLSSTNASNVDETDYDGDTTYNTSSSTGQTDTFNHGALSSTPTAIYGVQVVASMRKDDVTVQTGRTKLKSGGTTQNGFSYGLVNSVYVHLADTYALDPNTAAAWLGANVDASKIGYEHV